MERLKRGWRRTPTAIRKPVIFVIGWITVMAGLAMLALPGPGWATIFLGCAILATEFASAEKVRKFLVEKLTPVVQWCTKKWQQRTRKR